MVFYLWNVPISEITKMKASRPAVMAVLPTLINNIFIEDRSSMAASVREFLDNYWNNVHFVGETKLRQWLPKSFVPFPVIFTETGEKSDLFIAQIT